MEEPTNHHLEEVEEGIETTCPICYEEFKSHGKRERIHVDDCGHEFCLHCLASHCKVSIQHRDIPVPCPHVNPDEKPHSLTPQFVQLVLNRKLETKPSPKKFSNLETAFQVKAPPPVDAKEMDVENGFPAIEMNRTFSTQSSQSANSRSTTSSVFSFSSLPGYWNKYIRFQRLKEDPSLLSCPACSELIPHPDKVEVQENNDVEVIHNTSTSNKSADSNVEQIIDLEQNLPNYASLQEEEAEEAKEEDTGSHHSVTPTIHYPQLACPSCRHIFCAIHGDAHLGLTCEEYAQTKKGKDLDENERVISAMTKKCSHGCGARIVRISGCDHIICTNCNQDMCWKCGTHVFLSGNVIRSCSGCRQGFVDHRRYNCYRLQLLFVLPFHLALAAMYFAIIVGPCLLSCGFGCCFACGTRDWQWKKRQDTLQPRQGIASAAHLVCIPIVELIRDCGWMPHNPANDRD